MINLILASKSQARQSILDEVGVSFEVVPANIDESTIKASLLAERIKPRDIVDYLAEMKALAISHSNPGKYVIGSDQILVFEGDIFDKAKDMKEAKAKIKALAGKTHQLMSAVSIAKDGKILWRDLDAATLIMKQLSEGEIDQYIKTTGETILSSVGCYQLERAGRDLMADINGDFHTILGLPTNGLLKQLRIYGLL